MLSLVDDPGIDVDGPLMAARSLSATGATRVALTLRQVQRIRSQIQRVQFIRSRITRGATEFVGKSSISRNDQSDEFRFPAVHRLTHAHTVQVGRSGKQAATAASCVGHRRSEPCAGHRISICKRSGFHRGTEFDRQSGNRGLRPLHQIEPRMSTFSFSCTAHAISERISACFMIEVRARRDIAMRGHFPQYASGHAEQTNRLP